MCDRTLVNQEMTIQVNHCRNPSCENYGIPPWTMPGKTGPHANRDAHYKLHSTNQGRVPSLRCKACKENPPIKSNTGIAQEIARLIEQDGLWTLEEKISCKQWYCRNFGRSVAHYPREYVKRGYSPSGGQYYRCKRCQHIFVASTAPGLYRHNQRRAVDVFSRIANKAPIRGTVRGAGLKSTGTYYRILDFIHGRCLASSGVIDRAMIGGRIQLPHAMVIESDTQKYMLNWSSRFDRRNVEISGYCSVDSYSRFILAMHQNYDADVDDFEINSEAALIGDMEAKEPYPHFARYWLAGDDVRAGRSRNFENAGVRQGLAEQITALYHAAESHEDVEDIEHEHMDVTYRTPYLRKGMLIHMPYTTYAHWYLLRRLLIGAGVERFQFHFDIDSMTRAAFLCSFIEEVKEQRAHGFYVKYDKDLTVDERRRAVAKSRARRRRERDLLLPDEGDDIDLVLIKRSLEVARPYGKWDDLWVDHPNPIMNEPHKAMCWLTPDDSLDEDTVADMYLIGRLAGVDNVFQLTRRLFNAFERPLGTPSDQNAVWHGYSPYNPAMIQKYLTIFRTVNNFIQVGRDRKTPAMRLGLANKPLTYRDILWPKDKAAQPRQARRRRRTPLPK